MANEILFDAKNNEYSQTANSLFHFMDKPGILHDAIESRALKPRYCEENIEYLHLQFNGTDFNYVWALEKCFCDIPLHKINERFKIEGVGDNFESLDPDEQRDFLSKNTHLDFYGKYAIAFSKSWGEKHNLQPVHYLNPFSGYTKEYSTLVEKSFNEETIPDLYADDVVARLSMMKPLKGIMSRTYERKKRPKIRVQCIKTFYDEQEWRYQPTTDTLKSLHLNLIIANPLVIKYYKRYGMDINEKISDAMYEILQLPYKYSDVRYIIVPDVIARDDIIKCILNLPAENFDTEEIEDIDFQKYRLISKILVLDEIREDW